MNAWTGADGQGRVADPMAGITLRHPPVNLQAEQALLGALLANNKALELVEDFLLQDHFADPAHGDIYARIVARVAHGRVADAVSMAAEFERNDPFEAEGGGKVYLANLLSAMVSVVGVREYALTIRDAWVRREIIEACTAAVDEAFKPGESGGGGVVEALEGALTRIADGAGNEVPAHGFGASVALARAAAQEASKRPGALSGISSGYEAVDRMLTGLQPSTYTVLAARPSMGKTALGLSIAVRAAAAGARTLFWSGEMSHLQLGARAAAAHAGLSTISVFNGRGYDVHYDADPQDRGIPRELTKAEWDALAAAERAAFRLPLSIDDRPAITVQQLRARARRLRRTGGLDLIVVDYIGLMHASEQARRFSRYEQVTEISGGLLALAKELKVPLLVLAQLNRGSEGQEDKRPSLANLRDSGAIEQDADAVMFLHRPHYYLTRQNVSERQARETDEQHSNRITLHEQRLATTRGVAEVLVAKNRHGPTGATRLRFVDRTTWFYDDNEIGSEAWPSQMES